LKKRFKGIPDAGNPYNVVVDAQHMLKYITLSSIDVHGKNAYGQTIHDFSVQRTFFQGHSAFVFLLRGAQYCLHVDKPPGDM
jgi:hypothetical protein